MKMRVKKARARVPVSIMMPLALQQALIAKAIREDLTFSQLVRRAIRRDLGLPENGHA